MPSELKTLLDRLWETYHQPRYLASDPLEFVHRYADPHDQEAVALVSALFAYGNVKQIRRSVEDALGRIARVSGGPAEFVRGLGSPSRAPALRRAFRGWTHRFNRGVDLVLLLESLGASWRRHGSLGAQFVVGLEPGAQDFSAALDRLVDALRGQARGNGTAFSYLLTAPRDGSCCKRWCMLLRWMGRRDELDPGLWSEGGAMRLPAGRALRASQLVIPLDTHTGRISQYLGLTERKTLGWAAALEVTGRLRELDPADPVRYDFALARLGILDLCQRRYRAEICEKCQLRPACRFASGRMAA
jgi:uncharacterized protein (TIGR02757 family)